jgi:uncharacterized protein YrrD
MKEDNPMSIMHLSRALQGRSIVSVTNGQIVAKVEEILIDPTTRQVAAVITSKGSLLKREPGIEVIPGEAVQVWGRDVILVKRPEVIVKKDTLPGHEDWLTVSDQIKGHDVVGTDGTRIGQLNDVIIDAAGQLVGYSLARVFIQGPVAQSKRIAAKATRALGGDVLLVEPTEIVEASEAVEPAEMVEPAETAEAEETDDTEETMDPTEATGPSGVV